MKIIVLLAFIFAIHYQALPVHFDKRAPFDPCQFWNAFKGLLSMKEDTTPYEMLSWYHSLMVEEKGQVYKRMSGMSEADFEKMTQTTSAAVLLKKYDDLVISTINARAGTVNKYAVYGIDKVTLVNSSPSIFSKYTNILSNLIKTVPANNGKRVNFFGATPAWTDAQIQDVVNAYNAAQEMIARMIQYTQQHPGGQAFIDFFGHDPNAPTAVFNRLLAMQDQSQLNVFLNQDGVNGGVAGAIFLGGGDGGLGTSLNIVGINIQLAKNGFFRMPPFPLKVPGQTQNLLNLAKTRPSAGGILIHEISHMFGTEDVTGTFINQDGLAGTCYGRQRCLDLGGGTVISNNVPYNNADSYQFFAHEVYLST